MIYEQKTISYYDFTQVFLGKEIYNKKTGITYFKWEAYYKFRHYYEDVLNDFSHEFGHRDKKEWVNGVFKGRFLRKK